ncbi:MAG: alpha-N-arabinofuranosidase [Proteobacteria bacterium]|nr:alpha-N-arabinofuranosidase [Pseudomonadota bacterium]
MEKTVLYLHSKLQIGDVDSRIFGGFLEHMGRAVYEGVYEPESPHADEDGCRRDVLEALDRLKMTAMRYPGGNFASGYHWQDGIGPQEQRPTVRELAWQSIEPNRFGTDEFIKLSRKMDWTPMLSVNLGTGTPEEARNWVEYCNSPQGTKYANMRVENGNIEPHNVKLWCLGNEMDGWWQLGHVPAEQYAIRAQQAAMMMKNVDRSIEMVVCGSCSMELPTYMDWDRKVLEYVGNIADYVSLHRYVGNRNDDTADYLAVTQSIDRQIEETDAACRYVQAKNRSRKRAYLCFDEWNIWYKNMEMNGEGKFAPHLIEEVYNLEDALVAAGFLNSFIRHADSVKIANIAQIVNIIAPIQTRGDEMLIQSIYYPFEMFTKRRKGVSLSFSLEGPEYTSPSHGQVKTVDASVILDGNSLHVFAANRSLEEKAEICIDIADKQIVSLGEAELLTGPDAKAANSFENQEVVKARKFDAVQINDGKAVYELPPLSLTAVTFRIE